MTHQSKIVSDYDPIVALSSGSPPAAISILRFAGKGSHRLLLSRLSANAETVLREPRKMFYTQLMDANGEALDTVMAVFFAHGSSYTGEEAAELYLHGGSYIVKAALDVFLHDGFRAAEAGEFTRRAFLNGKLDLAAAEGVNALINAQSRHQWAAAKNLYEGHLSRVVAKLRKQIIDALAWLEGSMDFPDEEETARISRAEVKLRVDCVKETLQQLLSGYNSGKVAANGLRVALIGRPNVGKSTILNALLAEERAIVSDIPGTTRDFIEESCLLDGRLLRIVDTAGIRREACRLEKIGIERSLEIARACDLALFLEEAERITSEQTAQFLPHYLPELSSVIKIATKVDLVSSKVGNTWIPCSAISKGGLDMLKTALLEHLDEHLASVEKRPFITTVRHKNAVLNAIAALKNFSQAFDARHYEEVLAFELRACLDAIGAIVGEVSSDDILGVIFNSFCVGK